MCGRIVQSSKSTAYADALLAKPLPIEPRPNYNLCPTQQVTICRQREERELVQVRWGIVPHWAKEVAHGYSTINARAETVASKPAYRDSFKRRRCLIPVDGFYEWRQTTPKQPFYIHRADSKPFALAGIWDHWERESQVIESAAIIVTDGNAMMKPIHDRMPVIIDPENFEPWLDPAIDGHKLVGLLNPHAEEGFEAYPISTAVNKPANNSRELLERV